MRKTVLWSMLIWLALGAPIPLWSAQSNPLVLPCWDDPSVLCRGTPENPKILGVIDVNEGDSVRLCVHIFNCDVNESLSNRENSVHWLRQINVPPEADIVGPNVIECNVIGAVACRDPNGSCCSYVYMQWDNTSGYGGRVFEWLMETEEHIDPNAETHARGYSAVYINIRRAPPDFLLDAEGKCPPD